jgi:hypothetical protein
MTKKKLRSLLLEQIQLVIEDNKDEILDALAIEATEVDEDGESITPEFDVLEEAWEELLESLF